MISPSPLLLSASILSPVRDKPANSSKAFWVLEPSFPKVRTGFLYKAGGIRTTSLIDQQKDSTEQRNVNSTRKGDPRAQDWLHADWPPLTLVREGLGIMVATSKRRLLPSPFLSLLHFTHDHCGLHNTISTLPAQNCSSSRKSTSYHIPLTISLSHYHNPQYSRHLRTQSRQEIRRIHHNSQCMSRAHS